jgi:hypothetical protein
VSDADDTTRSTDEDNNAPKTTTNKQTPDAARTSGSVK